MSNTDILTGLAEVQPGPSVVSIGFFDGVHRGHRAIIEQAVRRARDLGARAVVVTFDRHPMEVIRPGSQPKLLQTLGRRVTTLGETGVGLVVVLPFDDELRHLSPEGFVDRVLTGPLGARAVVVGRNFRFGHKAAGDVATLTELGRTRGFETESVGLLSDDGAVLSSTAIRSALEEGDVETAARLLGRAHLVDGVVVRGDQRGAALGFPTANLHVDPRVAVPARGIYAGVLHTGEGRWPAATSIGVNPTFGGHELRVEAHAIGVDLELYGATVAVDFRHRLRGEERFDSADELVAQMERDVAEARRLLGT